MSTAIILPLFAFVIALAFALVVNGWRERFEEAIAVGDPLPLEQDLPLITLIIPVRDAADTIAPLLQDLHAQTWPRERLEVIVVDDGSMDGTAALVQGMARTWPQLRGIANAGEGKKAAITTGVEAAHGEWIVLTDADARCGPHRIQRIAMHLRANNSDLLLLPVATVGDGGLLARLQEAESSALLGVTAGTAQGGAPVLANGANMAFRRAAFQHVGGYTGETQASGDDLFLLARMQRARKRITYLLDREALVTVEPERSFSAFWRQRLRWAGKMRAVPGGGKWLGAFGLLLPWLLLVCTCAFDPQAAVGQGLFRGALLLGSAWLLWLGSVLGLTRAADRFVQRRGHLIGSTFALVAFTVYAPVIAVCGLFARPKWKGRRI